MTQDEAWLKKYKEVVDFINANKRNPSRYDDTERGMYVNWLRHNKKLFNAGDLKPERLEKFRYLMALMEDNKHKNQYQ